MKLTPFAKLFIALVIVGVVAYVVRTRFWPLPFLASSGETADSIGKKGDEPTKGGPDAPKSAGSTGAATGAAMGGKLPAGRIAIGVNDFGGAYPLILANDGAKPGPGSLFTKAGLDVEIKLIRGSKERLKAFDDGEINVMLLTLDYVANLLPIYKEKGTDLASFLFVDWSRGNVGIVAKPEFQSIESLKKARIATTRNTPTHYFLLSLLDKSNLQPADIETVKGNIKFATKTPLAGEMFQRGEVDAVAIWEPHLSQATAGGKGATLVTTETATNLIADVLFARREFLEENRDKLALLAEAYFQAVGKLAEDPSRAIALSAAAFEQKPEEIAATLKKIKPATFADNRAFFGLETEECPHDRLFLEASKFWQKEGLIKQPGEPGRAKWLKALETLTGKHKDEKVVESFRFNAAPARTTPSLLTKSISIYFPSGKSELDPNSRRILDGFADTLSVFQNAYVQVEGNTDNTGNRAANVKLSQARAQSVVSYLVDRHRFERARFIAIGNGPDAPVADNASEQGRELNRRTDFKLIKTGPGPVTGPAK